ncbi:MAG: hypothetical protein J6T25_04230 [Bacilli bacterium]|nr:hypothetical protein [Bacilli bacterium]
MAYIKWMDELTKGLKILFSILFLDLFWMVYRILKQARAKNWSMMVVWIVIAVFLTWIWWIVDLIFVIKDDNVIEF